MLIIPEILTCIILVILGIFCVFIVKANGYIIHSWCFIWSFIFCFENAFNYKNYYWRLK